MKRPLWVIGTAGILSLIAVMLTGYKNSLLLIAAGAGAALFFCYRKSYKTAKNITIVMLCAAVFLGLFAYKEACQTEPSLMLAGREISIEGQVMEPPVQKARSIELKLGNCTVNGEKAKPRFVVYTRALGTEDVSLYDTVKIRSFTPDAAAQEGEFYYHTLSGGYYLQGYANNAEVVENYSGSSLLYRIKWLRTNLRDSLTTALGPDRGAIASALLIGDRSLLKDDFISALRVSGASHMFAVSGMHLSLWSSLLFLILRKRSKVRVIPNIIASLFVVAYAALTGFTPSVLRAGIMMLSIFISRMIRRRSDPLNALGLSGAVMLLFNIYLAGNVSFLLSYSATAAIVILVPSISSAIRYKDAPVLKGIKMVKNTVFLSLGVLLFTVPFSGFFFGTVSLLSPVSTLICTIPVEFNMIASGLAALTGAIPLVGKFFAFLSGGSAFLIEKLVFAMGKLDFAVFPVHLGWLLLWYALTGGAAFLAWRQKKKSEAPIAVLLSGVLILLGIQLGIYVIHGKDVEIFIPDAGNSTSVCVSTIYGTNSVLIGTGRDYDAFEPMRDYCRSRGILTIGDLIIPRLSDAENGNALRLLAMRPTRIYSPPDNPSLSEETYIEAENYTLDLPYGLKYTNILSAHCAAGILENAELRIVLLYYPGGNYYSYREILQKGDYLICRGAIPEGIPTENFGKIIVLSDKSASTLHLPAGVKTSADAGSLRIRTSINEQTTDPAKTNK